MFSRFSFSRMPLIGDHVPIEEPLTDTTLRLSDGGACAVLEVSGWNAETACVEDINDRHARLDATLRNIAASDRLVISSYVCRGLMDAMRLPAPSGRLTPFATRFAADYLARLTDNHLYENRMFLAVHLRPPSRGNEWMARRRAAKGKADDGGERAIDRARRLEDICGWLASELAGYGVRPLGLAVRGRQVFSEAAEALAFAATGVWRPVGLTTGRIGAAMLCEEVAFHHETVEMRGPAHTAYAAMLSLKQYPAVTWPGMFDVMLAAPLRFTWAQHFEPLSPSGGMALLTRKQNKMIWADDKARSQIAEIDAAADDLASGRMAMGRHSAALAVFADRSGGGRGAYRRLVEALNSGLRSVGLGSVATDVVQDVMEGLTGRAGADPLIDVVNEAWKRLSGVGPTVVRENRAMMGAWKSLLPGNHRFRARPGACSTRNFAAMAPMHGFAKGAARSRWGAPIAILRNSAGEPYRFHWHDGEGDDAVGNTVVTGETGSGKAQPLDAKVLTPIGWRLMGELAVGDLVTAPDGKSAPITGIYPQGEKEIYRVTFEDGRTVECCDDHLWKVWRQQESLKGEAPNGGAGWQVLPLKEIRRWFAEGLRKSKRAAVPLIEAFASEFPPQDLPVPPYALGVLLGDGNLRRSGIRVFTADPQHILPRVMEDLKDYEVTKTAGVQYEYALRLKNLKAHQTRRQEMVQTSARAESRHLWTEAAGTKKDPAMISYRGETMSFRCWANRIGISPQNLRGRLRSWTIGQALGFEPKPTGTKVRSPLAINLERIGLLGKLSHEKFVPEIYKRGSVAQRLSLLQGLLDTDGHVGGVGPNGRGTHACFVTTSNRLALDVQEIAWSLGAIAKIVPHQTEAVNKDGSRKQGKLSYRVTIRHPDPGCLFSIPRKAERCRVKAREDRLKIMSVDPVGRKPAQCISVDHPDKLYVTNGFVVTHNTTATGFLIANTAGTADVIALDHKRGWDVLIRHLGGRYTVLGGGKPMFAPLKAMEPSEENITFLFDLFRGCIMQGGWRDLTPEEDRLLSLGLETVMSNPVESRSLSEIVSFLSPDVEPDGAGARLRRWCFGEELGWVLDAPNCALDLTSNIVGVDTTAVLANTRAAAPSLLYLFRRIAQRLDGRRPLLLPVDEGWRVLEDPIFYRPIAEQLRTIRSRNGVVVFITQSPADVRHSPVAAALLEQCPNQMHFPNPRASEADYVEGLKRTQGEFEALRSLEKGSGRFLICKGREGAVVELPLRGMDKHLAVLSASEASLRVLDALPDSVKNDPTALAEAFAAGRSAAHAKRQAEEVRA